MPLYEYYCEKCDNVFEALMSISSSKEPTPCPNCGGSADRIMPTTFAAMSRTGGYARRAPFHHHPVRSGEPKKPVARVKAKDATKAKPKAARKRNQK